MDAVEAFDPETETLLADLREGIRFEGSTGTLSLNSKARLNKLVEKTQNYGLGPIEIVVPADRLEQKAARAKAMAVQNYLESQGIDPLDIDVYTEGSPELSAAANDSAVQISIRPY
jgi:type IV pilus biogenesis protein CpaD/CtpE